MLDGNCIVCGSQKLDPIIRIPDVPVFCNRFTATAAQARDVARGELDLVHCRECDHVFNRAFDPRKVEYDGRYGNSLHHSPLFRDYAEAVSDRLVQRYDVRHKSVVEVGCGNGDFLRDVCARGENRGIGFDPAAPRTGPSGGAESVTLVAEVFAADEVDVAADLVCCRHVLEHLAEPVSFLRGLQRFVARTESVFYLEVPNGLFSFRENGIWDLIYEHCSYFTPRSLRRAVEQVGFSVMDSGEAFGGQFLYVEVAAQANLRESVDADDSPPDWPATFATRFEDLTAAWNRRLLGRRAAVWGAGSKGVMFSNMVPAANSCVACTVDINPLKQGGFIPGTGHPIVSPQEVPRYNPDLVIVMNPLYRDEVSDQLKRMGVQSELVLV